VSHPQSLPKLRSSPPLTRWLRPATWLLPPIGEEGEFVAPVALAHGTRCCAGTVVARSQDL
jgi:hypothetical protein